MKTPLSIASLSLVTILFIGCGGGTATSNTSNNSGNGDDGNSSQETKSIIENTKTVLTMPESKKTLTYSVVGGEDAKKFQINPQTGVLTFKTAPDFENPTDSNGDNIYEVTIQATDKNGKSTTQNIVITVTNDIVDDGPKNSSPNQITIKENKKLDFTITADGAISYGIEGEDQKRFQIDTSTGKLSFNQFLPDFEKPSDVNKDNNYTIDLIATDDQNYSSKKPFTVVITNDTSDDEAESNWVHIYKTGANDGPTDGLPFGDDRAFTAETIDGNRVIHVGQRMWQDDVVNKNAAYSFDDAQNYCESLDYAGFSDWRVPNRHELFEIVNYGHSYSSKPTIDDIFQNSSKINYRTSENVIGQNNSVLTNQAFVISFIDGTSYPLDRDNNYGVRCVRGERLTYTETITKDADDIYRDPKTGLWWGKPAGTENMESAKHRCEGLVFGGYDDWRLPNISEIHTIMPSVVPTRYHPYGAEPLLQDGGHQLWSSTPKDDTNGRYLDNYWNNAWNGSNQGRDVMNDETIGLENGDSVFSICIRGGHL